MIEDGRALKDTNPDILIVEWKKRNVVKFSGQGE